MAPSYPPAVPCPYSGPCCPWASDCHADSSATVGAAPRWNCRCHRHACADYAAAMIALGTGAAALRRLRLHFDAAQSPGTRLRWKVADLASFAAAAAAVVASSSAFARHSRPTVAAAAELAVAAAARKQPLQPSAPRCDAAGEQAAEAETHAGKSDWPAVHTHRRHCCVADAAAAGIVALEALHRASGYCRARRRCRCRCSAAACNERAATCTGRAR